MRHVFSLEEANLSQPSVVTIGKFDGVHRGHQKLIGKLVAHAADSGQVPIILTFFPKPEMVLQGYQPHQYLSLPPERARLLGKLGVDLVITHPFNDAVRKIRAVDFVNSLLTHTRMESLWVGEDFALGYQREGDIAFLKAMGKERGYEVEIVDLMDAEGERVSSTRIRAALREGAIEEANRLLGRPYEVHGPVVEGHKRGRAIGFPTANIDVDENLVIPANGVYAAWCTVDDEVHASVVNIGLRPTFGDDMRISVEAHLLDYSGNLYGKPLTLAFVARLRDEMKFDGVEALIAQITEDAEQGRALLAELSPPVSG